MKEKTVRLRRWDDYPLDLNIVEWIEWLVNEKAYNVRPTNNEGAD